jgi:Tfp pilus assembly protein PilF
VIEKLEALLASGQDGPTLRFALAGQYLAAGSVDSALQHAQVAVDLDGDYSAGWRLLGQVQVAAGLGGQAVVTFERGIAVAERRGDKQVALEMRVFLKRLKKQEEALAK